jgi:hypothetical protein
VKNLQNTLTKEMLEYEYQLLKNWSAVARKTGNSFTTIKKYVELYNIKYEKRQKYSCNQSFFKNDTPENFYVAGFVAADGSIRNTKYSHFLKINLSSTDTEHLHKIKTLLFSNHPIKEFIINKHDKDIRKCVEFKIFSNEMVQDLLRFNIVQNKTFIYTMPDWLISHPLVHHFMRGYFDGDGSISLSGLGVNRTIRQLNFQIIGTQKFAEQYGSILEQNCKLNHNKIAKHNNIYRLNYGGNKTTKKIYDFLYKDATVWLDRKREKFQKVVIPYEPNGALTII